MPSSAVNQCVDFDEVLCKKLLSLDLREPLKTATPVSSGHRGMSCALSIASGLASICTESAPSSSSHWGQHREPSPPPRWNKMAFWTERSVSMVESSTGSLGWASSDASHVKQPIASATSTLSVCSPAPSTAAPAGTISSRYKTELCRTFAERGVCKYGAKCQFAHGQEELRDLNRHPKYKTELCRTFHSAGFCPYGTRCHFVHNNEDDHPPAQPPRSRPPPLKHSFSFAGFPSNPPPPPVDAVPRLPYLRAPSASPPASAVSDLLLLAFPDLEPRRDTQPHFLPSPDSGCSACGLTPTLSPSQDPLAVLEGCGGGGAPLGARSLSHTSLSDLEGGTGSSASSLSGSDSLCGLEGAGRRLPIFSQLSVPEDSLFGEVIGGAGGFL